MADTQEQLGTGHMKPVDTLLLSIAIGLTLFTVYVFCAETTAAEVVEPAERRNSDFDWIVLHHSATHGGSAEAIERTHKKRLGGIAYHFIIGNGSGSPDGKVETTYRWRDQIPGPHTKNQEMNLHSVAICLVGNFQIALPTRKQVGSLLDLLERISNECNIPARRIISHREADPETLCPGKNLPMARLREVMMDRLRAENSNFEIRNSN